MSISCGWKRVHSQRHHVRELCRTIEAPSSSSKKQLRPLRILQMQLRCLPRHPLRPQPPPILPRLPNPGQRNVFTAQGRSDPNENTGISILNCKGAAAEDLIPVVSEFRNYLGRPWKEYSRTVYLLSHIEGLIDPAGWLEWDGDFALATLYYGEYMNRGPGANTSARVTWPGYRVINSSTEANQFTVGSFIEGGEWLPPTGIPFYLGLSSP
ncbi:hypothetical protein Nepgr_004436 [Nepenthes gracilis]|uniref:Pectinesterase catalytic domain-containing protein n=1 Tax=Nepenthes gracilis TaxID=150966 RepID=A0AAD3S1C8_NEPGR|nr:hypothetical protein Nepgr_004436 [Nepenthes gracilis]